MPQALKETNFHFPKQRKMYRGKVRDVYFIGDEYLAMVASDRISAFDHVLPKGIPYKGQVLNQLAARFLDATKDIVPNWLLAVPDPMVSIGMKCEPIKVEMVIRGYLSGHAWREYRSGKRMLCGVEMPEGMRESDPFPEPIITPATKAELGAHDENISFERMIELVGKRDAQDARFFFHAAHIRPLAQVREDIASPEKARLVGNQRIDQPAQQTLLPARTHHMHKVLDRHESLAPRQGRQASLKNEGLVRLHHDARSLGHEFRDEFEVLVIHGQLSVSLDRGSQTRSGQPHLAELRLDDLRIEGLHDVFVGAGTHRLGNVGKIVLGRTEHHFRRVTARLPPQRPQEVDAVHHRHVPVQQHRIGHPRPAGFQRLLAIRRFVGGEIEVLDNSPRDLAHDTGVIDDQATFHHERLPGCRRR